MPKFLKGNYKLSDKQSEDGTKDATPSLEGQSLTDLLEEKAMAVLGGSMSFVMKGKTFIWTGEEDGDK